MPRYYFNVRQNRFLLKDDEGADLDDLNAVPEEAVASVRKIQREAVLSTEASSLDRKISDRRDRTDSADRSRRTRDGHK